jgi:hypothetical protein
MLIIYSRKFRYIFILLLIFILFICCFISSCETENPGEPAANLPPDTYISEASAGTTTRISFYGTDKDGFVDHFEYQWASENEWNETTANEVSFEDVFIDQEELKTFRVRGYDNQGLADPTPAEVTLSPNNILPETEMVAGPAFGQSTGEDVMFIFKGKDVEKNGSIVKFEYTLDDLDHWQETSADLPQALYLGLSTGAHVFYVRAVDNLGGKDPSPAQVAFIVEGGKHTPDVDIQSKISDGGEWFSGVEIDFAWTASVDEYSGMLPENPFSYAIDDSTNFDINPLTPLSSGWHNLSSYRYLPTDGAHKFYLKVRDTAGGLSLARISFYAATPEFDKGVLVVNGVFPNPNYGFTINDRINQEAYWGSVEVDFWDIFGEMGSPNAAFTLPEGIDYVGGGGSVPVDILKHYSTIVWLGNLFQGDFAAWDPTLISGYLTLGGNVILATRWGADFLPEPLTNYLNIDWREGSFPGWTEPSTIEEYVSVFPGLVDMTPFDTLRAMDHTAVFSSNPFDAAVDGSISDLDITEWDGVRSFSKDLYTTLLFAHRSVEYDSSYPFDFVRGLGVWSHPNFAFSSLDAGDEFPGPGTFEAQGNFILLNGRNYLYNLENMTINFEFMIRKMCGEQ